MASSTKWPRPSTARSTPSAPSSGVVNDSAIRLATASQQLTTAADGIAESARTAAQQSDVVVASAGGVAASVEAVAAGAEEMESAIREIATTPPRPPAWPVSGGRRRDTNQTVGKLGESSEEIGNVVKLIPGSPSRPTCWPSTRPSRRPGRASGQGLRRRRQRGQGPGPGDGPGDRGHRARGSRRSSPTPPARSRRSPDQLGHREINDYQTTIAAAVEEQTATTDEMSRNMADASRGSQNIAATITGLADGTQATTSGVAEAQRAAADLSRMSGELQEAISRFRV